MNVPSRRSNMRRLTRDEARRMTIESLWPSESDTSSEGREVRIGRSNNSASTAKASAMERYI
jgi:hypothetical protein